MKAIVAAKAYVILYKRQIYRDIKIYDHQGFVMKRVKKKKDRAEVFRPM